MPSNSPVNRLPQLFPLDEFVGVAVAVVELSIGGGATAAVTEPVGNAPSAGWPRLPQSSAQFCHTGIFRSQYFLVK